MFRSTMVTGHPGQSGPPWPGELVIKSTIRYREKGKMNKSMVARWAYVKELAAANTRGRGIGVIVRNSVLGFCPFDVSRQSPQRPALKSTN